MHSSWMRTARTGGLCPVGGSLSSGVVFSLPLSEGTWEKRQTPKRNMGPGGQTGTDIILRPPPMDRIKNDRRE